MRIHRMAIAGLVTSLVVVLVAAPQSAGARSAGTPVDGVWRSDGYASVVSIEHGRAMLYDTTSISCAAGMGAALPPGTFGPSCSCSVSAMPIPGCTTPAA